MLSLNGDCLRLIIEKLPLADQISCFFVCERLKQILTEIWQPKKKGYMYLDNFKDFPLKCLVEYAHCISPNVEELYIKDIDLLDLENITFPKVHNLHYDNFKSQGLDIENVIENLFPKLSSLELRGNFTGKNLRNLKNLETLKLHECRNLQEEHFENIYLQLTNIKKLSLVFFNTYVASKDFLKKIILNETLEDIMIDDYHLSLIHDELFKLRKLKSVAFFSISHVRCILKLIIKKFGSILRSMAISGGRGWQGDVCKSIQKITALRKLNFYHAKIGDDQLQVIGASLSSTLEVFGYIDGHRTNSGNYDGLLEIVRLCKKLKILDVTGTKIDVSFVKKVTAIILSEDKKRNQVLVMHCSRTNIKLEDLETLQLPKKIKISLECKEIGILQRCDPFTFVHCKWNTPEE